MATAPPRYRAVIIAVDERAGHGCVWYAVLDGPRAGQKRPRPMEWPATQQSRLLWRALARAVGLDVIASPHAQLRGRVVQIEIADGTVGRIGHVYADDNTEAP